MEMPGSSLKLTHTLSTIKRGDNSIMVRSDMTTQELGYMTKIYKRLDAELYCGILDGKLHNTIERYSLDCNMLIFRHDNDLKHTAKRTRKWIKESILRVLE